MLFSEKKFLSLPAKQQHKKCAELLRSLYENLNEKDCLQYQMLVAWMNLTQVEEWTKEELSNRYHYHLEKASVYLKEHNLLPSVKTQDRTNRLGPLLPASVYLENIRSAHNVGSILRTAEGFGFEKIYFSSSTPYIHNKKVKDAAMGAENEVCCLENIPLSSLSGPIIALETVKGAASIYEYSFPKNTILILGNEEYGCSKEALEIADDIIEIPLYGKKNSLNVANAFSIAASEINRQLRIR